MSLVPRTLQPHLLRLGQQLPAVVVTGPRQSGKTTLCRTTWPDKVYADLERPDLREYARTDPRAFLGAYPDGAILDEIQRVPDLTSWLQVLIDEEPVPGRWVLTGSEHLALTQRASQSLAGRSAIAHLLPLDAGELAAAGVLPVAPTAPRWTDAVLRGGYPAPLQLPVELDTWLAGYVQTYLERDVRNLRDVGNLAAFQDFLGLAAGRSSQTINLSTLGGDVGVSHPTAKAWVSVLEASFVAFRLRPWHRNLGKRLTKASKLYFWDAGLLCHLLRIRDRQQLWSHPLRGALFETWVVAELSKLLHHRAERPEAWFYRDHRGLEVDLLLRRPDSWLAVEIKSGTTVASDFFTGLRRFAELSGGSLEGLPLRTAVVYGGDEAQRRGPHWVVPWRELESLLALSG